MTINIIGAGTWGTVLAQVLAENGNEIFLWHRNSEIATEIETSRQHHNLSSRSLHESINITSDISQLPHNVPMVIAVPSGICSNVVTLPGRRLTFSPKAIF